MWLMLALAVVVCVAVLYVPGYLFARSLFVSRFASVAIAPMISIFFLAVLGIVLFEVGVTCSGPVLLAIAVAIRSEEHTSELSHFLLSRMPSSA